MKTSRTFRTLTLALVAVSLLSIGLSTSASAKVIIPGKLISTTATDVVKPSPVIEP